MGLDGRLRDREFVGDLLVHQPVAQHHQHPHLLRREAGQPLHQRRLLVILLDGERSLVVHIHFARKHGLDGAPDLRRAHGFGQVAGGSEVDRTAHHGAVLDGRDDHDRHVRILRPEQHQAGKAAGPRHVEVEQHEVAVAVGGERGVEVGKGSGFLDLDRGIAARQRLAQCGPEQGVVIDDDDASAGHHTEVVAAASWDLYPTKGEVGCGKWGIAICIGT